MFTGIIEELGQVVELVPGEDSARVTVRGPVVTADAVPGASIAVNGVCLTVVELVGDTFTADVMAQTLALSSLVTAAPGIPVNLERPVLAGGRLGGHIVQGHVDGVGTIASIREVDGAYTVYVNAPASLMRYIVRKGSVAMDGISLTVVDAGDKTFSVAIIPHTWEHTNLRHHIAGDQINIETDIIGKYVEKLVGGDFARPTALSDRPVQVSDLAREETYILDAAPSFWE